MNVSIVIPVYNEVDQLPACLESIASQTVKPAEVIVVDNNSTDGSRRVAEGFPFVTVLNEKQQGIVYARNRGFNAAKSEIIARIDADSVLPNNWVEHILNFYVDSGHQKLAFTGGGRFYNVPFASAVSWLYNLMAFDFNRLLVGHATLWGSNMAITRRQWRSVRSSVCRINGQHEDLDLAIHLRQKGYGICYDKKLTVMAELRPAQARRSELWEYLQWWPRTLKWHRNRAWFICWLFGGLLLFSLTPILKLADTVRRLFNNRRVSQLFGERI